MKLILQLSAIDSYLHSLFFRWYFQSSCSFKKEKKNHTREGNKYSHILLQFYVHSNCSLKKNKILPYLAFHAR